jgi:hypothetical protein
VRLLRSFTTALANTKPGPCLHCCHFDRCASEKVACRDFQLYTNFKPVRSADRERHPNGRIYAHVFSAEDKQDGCSS